MRILHSNHKNGGQREKYNKKETTFARTPCNFTWSICARWCMVLSMSNTLKKALLISATALFVAGSLTLILWQSLRTTQTAIRYAPDGDGLILQKYSGASGEKSLVVPDFAEDSDGNMRPVVALGEFSVANANYLEELFIGANVRDIHPWALTNCEALRSVTVDPANPSFASADGVLYSRDMTRLILYPNMRGERFQIPPGVEVVGENAFYKCKNLREVEFPSSLRKIEEKAFFRCSGLESLILPEGLRSIGADAFAFCDGIEGDVTIPSTCREIQAYAFSGKNSKINKIYILAGEGDIKLAEDWLPLKANKAKEKVAFEFAAERK